MCVPVECIASQVYICVMYKGHHLCTVDICSLYIIICVHVLICMVYRLYCVLTIKFAVTDVPVKCVCLQVITVYMSPCVYP